MPQKWPRTRSPRRPSSNQRLGQPDIHRVLVPHPIQDRTDDELRQFARDDIDQIVAELS